LLFGQWSLLACFSTNQKLTLLVFCCWNKQLCNTTRCLVCECDLSWLVDLNYSEVFVSVPADRNVLYLQPSQAYSIPSSSIVILSGSTTFSCPKITNQSFQYASLHHWNHLPDSFHQSPRILSNWRWRFAIFILTIFIIQSYSFILPFKPWNLLVPGWCPIDSFVDFWTFSGFFCANWFYF